MRFRLKVDHLEQDIETGEKNVNYVKKTSTETKLARLLKVSKKKLFKNKISCNKD